MSRSLVLKILLSALVLGAAAGGIVLWWHFPNSSSERERSVTPDTSLETTPEKEAIPRKEETAPTPSESPAETIPAAPFVPFGTVTVSPDFFLDGAGTNIDSPEFFEAAQPTDTLLFVSGKGNDTVEAWQFPFVGRELPAIKRSSLPNGIAIDQERRLLYIGDSERRFVEVRSLPSLAVVSTFGKDTLKSGETNLDILALPNGDRRAFVSESHSVTAFDPTTGRRLASFSPDVESIEEVLADSYHQIIYVPEENGVESKKHPGGAITAYHPDGRPYAKSGSNVFGKGVFAGDGEGITLYACHDALDQDTGRGFIIAADQAPAGKNGFEFFDRETWRHLGTLILTGVSNTDGIDATNRPLPDFPHGLFSAANNDTNTAVVSWAKIEEAAGLRCQ